MYPLIFLLWSGLFYDAPPFPEVLPAPDAFAEEERELLLDFMNITNEAGLSNSQKICETLPRFKTEKSFRAHPMHWPGVTWEKKDGIYRVVQIVWGDADLIGTLDLRAFSALRFLFVFKHDADCTRSSKPGGSQPEEEFRLLLPENSRLEVLVCDNAGLFRLDLDGQTQLRHLSCEGDPIRHFDLSHLSKLEYFSCRNCPAESVRFASPPMELRSLSLSGECCSPKAIYAMKKLQNFCWQTESALPSDLLRHLSGCKELEFHRVSSQMLDLSQNHDLVFLTLTDLPALTVLDLRDSEKLEYLEITDCPKLRRIILPAALHPDRCSEDEVPLWPELENTSVEEIEFSDGTKLSLEEFLENPDWLEDDWLEDEGLEDEGLEDEGLEDEGLEGEGLEDEGLEVDANVLEDSESRE